MEFVGIKGCKVGESIRYVYEHDMNKEEVSEFKKFITNVFNKRLFELTAFPDYKFDEDISCFVLDSFKHRGSFDYDLLVNGKEAPIPRSTEMMREIYAYIWKNLGMNRLAPCYISFDEEAHVLIVHSHTNQAAVEARILEDKLEYEEAKAEKKSFLTRIKEFL